MPKKKKRKRNVVTQVGKQAEATKAVVKPGFFHMARLGLRITCLALFPIADVFQRFDLEWLALIFLLGSALVLYEMLDYYRKFRFWRNFFLVLAFYILSFGVLMLSIILKFSWAHSSNVGIQIIFTLPRLIGAYYLIKMLLHIYPYR
ncbi:hypothetical protein H5T87_06640 [bacterium]|nr:hypothetical protein [bacterium]